jgi:hypothetical protein
MVPLPITLIGSNPIHRHPIRRLGFWSHSARIVEPGSRRTGRAQRGGLEIDHSSNFVGACTGRSAGLSPLRMRSTYPAERQTGRRSQAYKKSGRRTARHLAALLRGPRAAAAILPGAASPGSAARISRQPARPRSILVENRNGRSNRAGRRTLPMSVVHWSDDIIRGKDPNTPWYA